MIHICRKNHKKGKLYRGDERPEKSFPPVRVLSKPVAGLDGYFMAGASRNRGEKTSVDWSEVKAVQPLAVDEHWGVARIYGGMIPLLSVNKEVSKAGMVMSGASGMRNRNG